MAGESWNQGTIRESERRTPPLSAHNTGIVDSARPGLLLSRSWGHRHKVELSASKLKSSLCSVYTIVTRCGLRLTCGTTTTCQRTPAQYWLVCETALCPATARGRLTRSKRSKDGLTSANHLEYCRGRPDRRVGHQWMRLSTQPGCRISMERTLMSAVPERPSPAHRSPVR